MQVMRLCRCSGVLIAFVAAVLAAAQNKVAHADILSDPGCTSTQLPNVGSKFDYVVCSGPSSVAPEAPRSFSLIEVAMTTRSLPLEQTARRSARVFELPPMVTMTSPGR